MAESTYIIKQSPFEGLIKGLGVQNDPKLLEELKQTAGYDSLHPAQEYPLRTFFICCEILRKNLFPNLLPEEAYYIMGRKQADGFVNDTIYGRITYAARSVITTLRLLDLFLQNHAINAPFGRRTLQKISPNKVQLHFENDPSTPAYIKGLLYGMLEVKGETDIQITYQVLSKHDTVYDVSWK